MALTISACGGFEESAVSSPQKVVKKKKVERLEADGSWAVIYVLLFANGGNAHVTQSVYNESRIGGGYESSTDSVLSPSEEEESISAAASAEEDNSASAESGDDSSFSDSSDAP